MPHNHDHGDHKHSHEPHGHSHWPVSYNSAFAIGAGLNIAFVLIELAFGYFSNSLALIADAVHNASDVLGLFIAWGAIWLATRKPTSQYTYGFGRGSILSSLLNAILIFVAAGGIFVEAMHRFGSVEDVASTTVIWVAIIGIAINAGTALLFMSWRKKDINVRGAFVHMAVDALVSFGVVVSAVIMMFTGFTWIDALISMIISVIVILTTWSLLRDSLSLSLDKIPKHIDRAAVEAYLKSLPWVMDMHDLHIWPISTSETWLTVHLILSESTNDNRLIETVTLELHERFSIGHPTIQIERNTMERTCKLEPNDSI